LLKKNAANIHSPGGSELIFQEFSYFTLKKNFRTSLINWYTRMHSLEPLTIKILKDDERKV